ncbi:MAG: tetratricopeptide repeat protein [Ignavibacteria bacterium]|jgi:outer membrane protein assembly factor BamD (BamD/ComL family)
MNLTNLKKFKLPLIIAVLIYLSGCGVWENFTTYFNLYYNARELFEKAEKQINEQEKDLFSTEVQQLPGTAKADLIKVIEKCSEILQFNSESAYVEEALLMLGKSYYYQWNYQKSLRKFNELKNNYPETDYLTEVSLWIAKNQFKLKNYNDGLTTLAEVKTKAVEEDDDEIINEAYLEEIVYRVNIEDYKSAIDVANEFLSVSGDKEIKAQVWYEVGRLNMKIGDIESAIIAFENVFEYSPDFDLEFDANLKYGIALREGDKGEEALVNFFDMRDEDKYEEDYAEIDLEIAKTNRALGNIDLAINQLIEVDTLYRNTNSGAASKYELAQVYEYDLNLLDSAAVYYEKASRSPLEKEFIEPAREKDLLFKRYANLSRNIAKYNEQLFYIENPEEFKKDSIAYVKDSLVIAEEISKITELQEIWSGLSSLINQQDTTGFYADTVRAIDTLIFHDSTLVRISDTLLTMDSLLVKIRNQQTEDSTLIIRFDSLFTSAGFTQSRQINLLTPKTENFGQQSQLTNQLPDSLKFKNDPPRRSNIPIDSLHSLLAKNELELGNLYLTEMNLPDTARWFYENILTNYANTSYVPNTLYALGSYYLTVDNKHKADSLFEIIYQNYKDVSIVNAAADKLNKPFIDLDYDPAKEEYENAELTLLSENYSKALDQFTEIYKNHPNSVYAPKSLYTSGWILEHKLLLPESAAVVYDSLVSKYPATVYVKGIAGKLAIFKQEQSRLKLAEQDSLRSLELTYLDSSKINSKDSALVSADQTAQDTIQVAIEDGKKELKTPEEKISNIPEVKEPLWNPRRRK